MYCAGRKNYRGDVFVVLIHSGQHLCLALLESEGEGFVLKRTGVVDVA